MKNNNALSSIILFLVLTANLSAQGPTAVPGGNVSGTWIKANSPYEVQGDITIASGDTLTIEPGVTVEFQGYYKLSVWGRISAVGAENDTILFTVNDPSDYDTYLDSTLGSWNGIEYYTNPDSSLLDICKLEYGKALDLDPEDWTDERGGALFVFSDANTLVVRRCHFYHNYASQLGGAIVTNGSDFPLEDCLFTYNRSGEWGGAVFGKIGKINHNVFTHNQSSYGGALAFWGITANDINENIFRYNSATSGGAIYSSGSFFTLTNNIIANNHANSGGAIYCSETSYPEITGNLVVNNAALFHGGGIALSGTNAVLVNNTISNNSTALHGGGGLFSLNCSPEIQNSIIWGNEPDQVYLQTNTSSPDIYYSNLQGGVDSISGGTFNGRYENNTDLIPEFVSPTEGAGDAYDGNSADWSLKQISPCINMGNPGTYQLNLPEKDVYGNVRIKNNIIDMGAAEKHISVVEIHEDIDSNQTWISDTVKIFSDVSVVDGVTLKINAGTVVQFQDYYQMAIQGVLLARGTKENLIRFTVPAVKESTGWAGLRFDNSDGNMFDNDSSLIEYCQFEYAKNYEGGGIYVRYFSDLIISHSIFMHDTADYGAAIYVGECAPLILNNIISHNHSDHGAIAASSASPEIIGNTITYNTSNPVSNPAGGIYGSSSDFLVQDNFIANNQGGFYARNSTNKEYALLNNIIVNNQEYGIFFGSGIHLYALNNTVANNEGYGFFSYGKSRLTLINNIFWGNDEDNIDTYLPPDENPIKILNCNIQGGIGSLIWPAAANLEYDHIIDQEPSFVNPTDGTGWAYESVPEDWKLFSVSPCINEGLMEDFPYALPATDMMDQPRVFGSSIDIGAAENQDGLAIITEQPANHIVCEGDTISLMVSIPDTAYLQWQKDGLDIPGATIPVLAIDSATIYDEGNYQCIITNAYGQVKSNQVYVLVRKAPEILSEPASQWLKKDESSTLRVYIDGSSPLSYQWKQDGVNIPGAITPEYKITHPDYDHEGDYTCNISNACGIAVTSPATIYIAPQLCMVTVSETSGDNLVVWEKKTKAPVFAYNVYRISESAGIYDKLATVPFDDLSVFVDSIADPTMQAYLYKITAIDTGNNETDIDLCKPHKTIHLLVSTNTELNTTQLAWDKYYGFDYNTYNIYRSNTGTGFSLAHSISSDFQSWTDTMQVSGDLYYRIAVERPDPCYPSAGSGKAGAGPYHHALSNLDNNRLQAGQLPPDTLTLDHNSIYEENAPGTYIGRLTTVDRDTIDAHTYHLIPGEGDDDNFSFTLAGNLLLAARVFDYETKNSYSIRVRTTDLFGNYYENIFNIEILDVNEATGLPVHHTGNVKAFPNPFRHATTITFPNPNGENYSMKIMNLSGKVVRVQEDIRNSRLYIEKGNLEKGLYLIELRGEKIYRGKLMVE